MAPTRKLGELFYELGVRTEGLKKDLDQSERAFGKLTNFVLKNPVIALTAIGTAAAGAAVKAVQAAAQIDESMRKVASSVPAGTEGLKSLRQELERISLATGKTQDELAQASEVIARAGAGSAEEVAQRLRAAVDASQATGSNLEEIILGLDQTLDLFQISSVGASRALAELFTVARGRASLDDVFQTLEKAAPSIQKLGLDLPTASRALIQLTESGLSTEKAAIALKKLADGGEAGRKEVEKLAAVIPKAADPMSDLAKAAQQVNDAATNVGPRLRAELNAALITLGQEILPAVNSGLQFLLQGLQRLRGGTTKDLQNAFVSILDLGPRVFEGINGKNPRQWTVASGNIREVSRAVTQLAEAASEGRVDLQQFGVDGLGRLADNVARLSRLRIFDAQQQQDLRIFLKQITQAQAALVKLNQAGPGRASPPTGTTGGTDDSEEARKARLDEANRALDEARRKREESERELARAGDVAVAQRTQVAEALVSIGEATVATFVQLIDDYQTALRDAGFGKNEIKVLTQAKFGVKDVLKDLSVAKTGLAELNRLNEGSRDKQARTAEDRIRQQEAALAAAQRAGRAVEDIGKLVLSAANAFGELSDEATKALSAVIDVGAGIARAFSGDAAGGSTQLASGLLQLATQAFGKDPAAEERRRQHAENLAALKEISKNTGDLLGVSTSGRDIGSISRAVEGLLAQTGAAGGFRRFGTGPLRGINEANVLEAQTGLSFKEIEALAKSLGITLDGTKQSYVAFLAALKSIDLEAFGKGFTGQIRKLEIEARLDPKAFEGIDGIIKRLQVLAGPDGAPAIAKALEGIDVTSTEGRAAAIAKLTDVLRNVSSLSVEDLGGLSLDQFIEEILSAIEKLRDAEPAVRSASETFTDAMDAFAIAVELGSLTVGEKLDRAKALFADLFPDLASSLDFTSADSFKASIASIIDGFAADGELSDAEREQIAILRLMIDAFDGATPAAETFVDALSVLDAKFRLFNTSLTQQFEETFAALAKQFPEIAGLLDGIDITSPEGRAALEARIQAFFTSLAADGLTEQEQAIVDALTKIFGLAQNVADEAAKAAEDAATVEKARRQRILDNAENQIRLNDVTDPAEQLQIRVAALGKAFPELAQALDGFDLATQSGRDALEAWIRQMFETPGALEDTANAVGLSVEELIAKLLGLEDGADAATDAVQSLADQLQSAFDEIDFDVALNNITDPIAKLQKYARGIAATIPAISQALAGIDLSTATGRRQAEAALVALGKQTTDPTIRSAILNILDKIRTLEEDTAGLGGPDPLAAKNSALNVQSAATVTEVTANRWLDVMTTDLALSRERNAILAQIFASVASAPIIRPPALAGAVAAGPGTVINVEIPVNFLGPVTTADATELAALLQQSIYRVITQELAVQLQVSQRLAGKAAA